jgi:class 3 adenylate cyclase
VRCMKCELENRAGRKFCASCGTALPVPCESCGFPNEAAERYCGGCGHVLAHEKIAAVEAGRNVDPGGDRRPVTVLFCDLVGYTRLSAALDAEDVHAMLECFFALVDATVDRFGGTIDKHIGDAAMALFGAPLARGNDAERAVRAALEIQASVPKLASGLPSALAVHIGIATGEVIASSVGSQHHRGYTVTGEAANIAARLLEKAVSGETLVSDDVYQATNHVVSYQPLGPLALKGVGHSVEAWRPTGIRSSAPQTHALVGRRSELGQFRAVLDACVNGATGTAVLIRGEAGIGKTRLMDELQSIAAASDMSCTAGFVLDFGTARGHGAVRTLVAGLLGLGSEVTPDIAECAIEEILRDGRLQADDALYLRDLLEMPPPETMRKHYEAIDAAARTHGKERVVAALAKASADSRPLLVTVEDVHWADPETLSLLAAITRATAMSRTVLVMTTRIEGDPLDAHWRSLAGGGTLVTVDLSPLSPADARSIARRFIDVAAFADQCVERAGGNPLFLEQLLRGAADLTDGRLPASIQSVVLARTDLLSAQDRRAIQAASVLGQRFNLAHLRALLQEPKYDCDTLVRNVLIRPARDGLQFAHALVRDGVYGRSPTRGSESCTVPRP